MEGGAACLGLKGASNIFRESDDEADLAGGLDLVVVGAPPKISSSAVFEEFPTSAKISSKAAVACAAGFLAGAFLGSAFVSLLGSSFLAACSFFGSSFFISVFCALFLGSGFVCLLAGFAGVLNISSISVEATALVVFKEDSPKISSLADLVSLVAGVVSLAGGLASLAALADDSTVFLVGCVGVF